MRHLASLTRGLSQRSPRLRSGGDTPGDDDANSTYTFVSQSALVASRFASAPAPPAHDDVHTDDDDEGGAVEASVSLADPLASHPNVPPDDQDEEMDSPLHAIKAAAARRFAGSRPMSAAVTHSSVAPAQAMVAAVATWVTEDQQRHSSTSPLGFDSPPASSRRRGSFSPAAERAAADEHSPQRAGRTPADATLAWRASTLYDVPIDATRYALLSFLPVSSLLTVRLVSSRLASIVESHCLLWFRRFSDALFIEAVNYYRLFAPPLSDDEEEPVSPPTIPGDDDFLHGPEASVVFARHAVVVMRPDTVKTADVLHVGACHLFGAVSPQFGLDMAAYRDYVARNRCTVSDSAVDVNGATCTEDDYRRYQDEAALEESLKQTWRQLGRPIRATNGTPHFSFDADADPTDEQVAARQSTKPPARQEGEPASDSPMRENRLLVRPPRKPKVCYGGCCFRAWRDYRHRAVRENDDALRIQDEAQHCYTVSHAICFPPFRPHWIVVLLLLLMFGALSFFLVMSLTPVTNSKEIAFSPFWSFVALAYPTLYVFFSSSSIEPLVLTIILIIGVNLTAVLSYFYRVSLTGSGHLPWIVCVAPLMLALACTAVHAVVVIGRRLWTSTEGGSVHVSPSLSGYDSLSPRVRRHLVAIAACPVMLLSSLVVFACELDGFLIVIPSVKSSHFKPIPSASQPLSSSQLGTAKAVPDAGGLDAVVCTGQLRISGFIFALAASTFLMQLHFLISTIGPWQLWRASPGLVAVIALYAVSVLCTCVASVFYGVLGLLCPAGPTNHFEQLAFGPVALLLLAVIIFAVATVANVCINKDPSEDDGISISLHPPTAQISTGLRGDLPSSSGHSATSMGASSVFVRFQGSSVAAFLFPPGEGNTQNQN